MSAAWLSAAPGAAPAALATVATAVLGALYACIADKIREPDIVQALRESVPPATADRNVAAFEKGKQFIQSALAVES